MWHAQRAPGEDMWLGAGAGVRAGVSLNYLIWIDEKYGVELYINTGDNFSTSRFSTACMRRGAGRAGVGGST